MDIGAIITSTISTLHQQQPVRDVHAGEITLAHAESPVPGTEAGKQDIETALRTLNSAASRIDNRISFDYNEKTKRMVLRIVDPDTSEVVKQIPTREMIKVLENIHEMVGIIIDTRR
jgi:uncharacterized FlaG/YvyC family protein